MLREIAFDDLTEVSGLDDTTVDRREFALDGTVYEIHLTDENYARLCAELADYVNAARVVSGKRVPRVRATGPAPSSITAGAPTRPDPEQNQAMREWARTHGYPIKDRGRTPLAVQAAYHANDPAALRALIPATPAAPAEVATPTFSEPVTVG